MKIRALKSEETLVELREDEKSLGLNGNGSYKYNGSVNKNGNVNGSANGSLMKYVNGNGGVESNGEVPNKPKTTKRTVEEIGQEDAWFKQKNSSQAQVYIHLCNV